MKIDLSFLPALGAAFLLVFARTGTMLMLLPGLGEQNISARIRLTFALILAGCKGDPNKPEYWEKAIGGAKSKKEKIKRVEELRDIFMDFETGLNATVQLPARWRYPAAA